MKDNEILFGLCMMALVVAAVILPLAMADNIVGSNYRNVTVRTSVNITNSKPEVIAVAIYQESNVSLRNITLSGGGARIVTCNATVRDWNGYNDVTSVNATLFDASNAQYDSVDNNNTHYTNSSCTNSGNGANYTVNYMCGFNVYYYANNGTWNCTVFAFDTFNKTGNLTNSTTILALYSLNVTNTIDF